MESMYVFLRYRWARNKMLLKKKPIKQEYFMNEPLQSKNKSKQIADLFTNFRPYFTGVDPGKTIVTLMTNGLGEEFTY